MKMKKVIRLNSSKDDFLKIGFQRICKNLPIPTILEIVFNSNLFYAISNKCKGVTQISF